MAVKKHLSITVHCIYLLITALQLIFVPNMLLGMFGFEPTQEVWIKVLGVVVLALSVLFYGINAYGNADVKRFSIYERLIATGGFILLAVSGQAPMTLILFAGIDAMTAVWTFMELKKEG